MRRACEHLLPLCHNVDWSCSWVQHATALLCLGDTVGLWSSSISGVRHLFAPFSLMVPGPWRGMIWMFHLWLRIPLTLIPFSHVWVSTLTTIYSTKKLLRWGLKVTPIYEYKDTNLGSSLKLCPLNRIISWGLWDNLLWVLEQIYSNQAWVSSCEIDLKSNQKVVGYLYNIHATIVPYQSLLYFAGSQLDKIAYDIPPSPM